MEILKPEANYLKRSNLWYNIAYCDFGMYFCQQNAVRFISFVDVFAIFVYSTVSTIGTVHLEILQQNSEQNMCNQNEKEYKKYFWSQVCNDFVESYSIFDQLLSENVGQTSSVKYSRNVYPGISKYTFNCIENLLCEIVSTFAD